MPLLSSREGNKNSSTFFLHFNCGSLLLSSACWGLCSCLFIIYLHVFNSLNSLFQVGKAQQVMDPMQIYEADQVWPFIPSDRKLLRQLGSSYGAMTYVSSDVSCIKASRSSLPTNDTFSKYFLYPFWTFEWLCQSWIVLELLRKNCLVLLIGQIGYIQDSGFVLWRRSNLGNSSIFIWSFFIH